MTYKNIEGYSDPTAGQAMTSIKKQEKKYRPLVYICSPYAGDTQKNTIRARRYSRFAVEQGCIPVAPHLLYPQFIDDSDREERKLGLFFGRVLLDKCEEIWIFGDRITDGMRSEIDRAKRKHMKIKYFNVV